MPFNTNDEVVYRWNIIQYYINSNVLSVCSPNDPCRLPANIIWYQKETGMKIFYKLDFILFGSCDEFRVAEAEWKHCLFNNLPMMSQ